MLLRSVLERATHRIVIGRRLPAQFGKTRIYVSTEGGLRYLLRDMSDVDPVLLQLAADVSQAWATAVWDVGANVGLFSFAAAAAAGPAGNLLAVEPDTALAGLLRRSAAARPRARACCRCCPPRHPTRCPSPGSTSRGATGRRATSTVTAPPWQAACGSPNLVPTVTLDWLAARFPAPDVLKIDVEGAELAGPGWLPRNCSDTSRRSSARSPLETPPRCLVC